MLNSIKLLLFSVVVLIGVTEATLFAQTKAVSSANVQEKPRLNAFKTAPLGPMVGNWGITYERGQVFKDHISLEVNLGYKSAPLLFGGWLNDAGAGMSGFYVNAGPKIYFGKQEFYIPGMVRTHPMFGWYFKPEVGVRHIVYSSDGSSDVKSTAARLVFNFGKQWISNNFVFELYTGVGYAYRNYEGEGDFLEDVKDEINENFPVTAQSGIRLGFLSK
ncbi:hypothetical protein C7N43_28280 [Sphingobacteriales bacterium UPWRP_1]|nr:hypothetical protein BVG80_18175 [Sphingobacteriales bacterium TSM_CSM]PSJ73607.1 hypothetical protein C7N43_28280 [Sphingobacteriales bacterium UPWRP_1]